MCKQDDNNDTQPYFCEKCNLLSHDAECIKCGRKNLRKVTDDDFCYFVTLSPFYCNILEANLKEQNIPVATLGSGIEFARRTSGELHVFIPYGHFDRVRDIYYTIFGIAEDDA